MRLKLKSSGNRLQWHEWFAWYPVKTQGGELVWFETVMRREVWFKEHLPGPLLLLSSYEYRLIL